MEPTLDTGDHNDQSDHRPEIAVTDDPQYKRTRWLSSFPSLAEVEAWLKNWNIDPDPLRPTLAQQWAARQWRLAHPQMQALDYRLTIHGQLPHGCYLQTQRRLAPRTPR